MMTSPCSLSRAAAVLLAIVAALSMGPWLAPAGAEEAKAPAPSAALKALGILDQVPFQDAATAEKMMKQLAALGAQGVRDVAALLVEPGPIDDSKARYAMHGLAVYVGRPGAQGERKVFCTVLGELLGEATPKSIQAFLIQQLRLAGGAESISAISKALPDERLCEDAAHALVSIGGEQAKAAFRKALPKAKGKGRATIIQNLGVMRDATAVPELLKAAKDTDRDVRLAAVYALANIGDTAASETLLVASGARSAYERAVATDAVLLLAQRLGDAGNSKEAARIYRTLWKQRTDPAERHVRCAAILGLANSQGIDAMDELVAAMNSADLQIRAAATQAAVSMPGEDVTKKWVAHLESVSADAKPGVIALLAERGGEAARGAILDAMRERDEGVRLAAIEAARVFKGTSTVPPLIAFLASKDSKSHDAAQKSLERIPGDEASAAIASALGAAAPEVRRDLLGVLTVRGARQHSDAVMAATKDRDKGVQESALRALEVLGEEKHVPAIVDIVVKTDTGSVRGAAEKALGAICGRSNRDNCVKSILPAMAGAGVDAKCALIRVLGKVPSPKGLDAVRAALKGSDARIQDAAVRALSEWPSRAVAPDLLQIARSGRSRTQQVLALRGFVRLVKEQKFKNADKVAMYKGAMVAAKRPDEKKMILSALGEVKDIAAVKLIAASLGDAALREEAAAAAVRIGRDFRGDVRKEPLRQIIVPTMQKVLEISKNKNVRRDAERVLKEARRK